MKVRIRQERCKQCGLCIVKCPKGAISFIEEINGAGYRPVTIDDVVCIGCGICYTMCPEGVYEITGK